MSKKTIYEDKVLRREIEMKAANDFEEKLSADEVSMCILTMERKRVSFFADHLWPNRRMGKLNWSLTADGRRAIAHQNGLAGMEPPEFEEGSGDGHGRPEVCRVKVYRKMFYNNGQSVHLCAYHGEARWSEFVGLKRNGEVNAQWKQRPYNQLAKCAEMQALRRGFPEGELLDDGGEMMEEDDVPLNEVASASVTPAPTPDAPARREPAETQPAPGRPEPEPEPKPEPAPTVDSLRAEGTPLLKAYCDKLNDGKGLSWKAAYTKLTGVVGDKQMEVADYQVLMSCLREALEASGG